MGQYIHRYIIAKRGSVAFVKCKGRGNVLSTMQQSSAGINRTGSELDWTKSHYVKKR